MLKIPVLIAKSLLMPLVYNELHHIAARGMRRERPNHTLQPTVLLDEAYLRLIDQRGTNWANRAHFFAIAAVQIRRILVEYARQANASKRGGKQVRVSLHALHSSEESHEILALHDALEILEERDPRKARIVELKYFGGLTIDEVAKELQCSPGLIDKEWKLARAWLFERLRHADGHIS